MVLGGQNGGGNGAGQPDAPAAVVFGGQNVWVNTPALLPTAPALMSLGGRNVQVNVAAASN